MVLRRHVGSKGARWSGLLIIAGLLAILITGAPRAAGQGIVLVSRSGTTNLFEAAATPSTRLVSIRPTAVLSTRRRIETLAADANRAAFVTVSQDTCAPIVVWTAPRPKTTSFKEGDLGCHWDGVAIGEVGIGGGQVAWIEVGGGNNLEMKVMAANLRGGAAKQIDYVVNGDRAGGDPTGDWVGRILGSGSLLAYNNWSQVCDRPPDSSCGESDSMLRVTNEKLVQIVGRRRSIIGRGSDAYPLTAVGGGRLAVRMSDGVKTFAPGGAALATVKDADSSIRGVALSRTTLALKRKLTLDLYHPVTGAAQSSFELGSSSGLRLADVTSKLALLRGPRRLALLRLGDGKQLSLPLPRAATLVAARLTEAGLFYAYNTKQRPRPGRIVFESSGRLLAGF